MDHFGIIVIGAGSGGLVVAIGAAKAGKRVLLIEKGPYGGDCTNYGCIPSKSLIASARIAHATRTAKTFGINLSSNDLEGSGALKRVQRIVEEVRSHEEPDALSQHGVITLTGVARFTDPHTLQVTDSAGKSHHVRGKKIVIATGSSPIIPPVKGLKETPYLTNETVFSITTIPKTLAILGGGPIGCELAQAFQRLGAQVHLIHRHNALLGREEPEAQQILAEAFRSEGVDLHLGKTLTGATFSSGRFSLKLSDQSTLSTEALLVSVGRRPNVAALDLKLASVEFSELGIKTDAFGRTTQKHIFALGDVKGPPFFTHYAEAQARSVLKTLLLPWPFKQKVDSRQPLPRCTYTDPEIASVGLTTVQAHDRYKRAFLAIYTLPFSELDRAISEGREEGFVTVITKKWSSRILGATIVGPRAGEMISELTAAIHAKLPFRKLSSLIHPFPTYNLAIRKAADKWLTETVLGAFKKKS